MKPQLNIQNEVFVYCSLRHVESVTFSHGVCPWGFHELFLESIKIKEIPPMQCRECVKSLDLRVQVHPGVLWVSKQRVHIVLEASKSAGAKGDVPKICGSVHPC